MGKTLPPIFLVVEILSPSQSFLTMRSKAERYLNWGVEYVRLIDPESETALVFSSDQPSSHMLFSGQLRAGDIAVPLADLFI